MDRSENRQRGRNRYRPSVESVEGRILLSPAGALGPFGFLFNPPGVQLVRPNTPVAPFGSPQATATFVDPTVRIHNGAHVVVGQKTYIGPFAALDATVGFIKIGSGSEVLDNAVITATPGATPLSTAADTSPTSVRIGDMTSIGYGATVNGPSTIGAYGKAAKPTGVGPNAVVNGAVISPGAVVGALAYVGPGVTIPAGDYVKPGAEVTTQAEASDPALGKVEKLPANVLSDLTTDLARGSALANGYTFLYQGQSATGASPGVDPTVSGVFNGNLAAVLGTSQEPGTTNTTITFEPSRTGPKFPGPHQPAVEADVPTFPGRVTGDARFAARLHTVARRLGRLNSFRADQGQPIVFLGAPTTGTGVVINSPLGGTTTTTTITGTLTTKTTGGTTTATLDNAKTTTSMKTDGGVVFGPNVQAGDHVVVLGGPGAGFFIGDNSVIGSDSVITRSDLGLNVTVGAGSYIANSTIPSNTVIPPGTIEINNKVVK